MKLRISNFKLQTDSFPAARMEHGFIRSSQFAIRHTRAFTLIELLVVMTILGILAALTVPALKEMGKANVQAGATRQMLDAVARARQLAISRHTTVYMVFVPTNFFNLSYRTSPTATIQSPLYPNGINTITLATDRQAAFTAVTNLIPLQLTGYNYLSLGKVGDQPGQHQWSYISEWDSLPDGTYIPPQKFQSQNYNAMLMPQWQSDYSSLVDNWISGQAQIYGFAGHWVPFPTEESPLVYMPCLIFDYQGRLVSEQDTAGSYHHAYIPLAQGSVGYGMNPDKQPQPTPVSAGDIIENPPGNSTNISYTVIDINPLTGRAALQQFKMQ
jgi:prepilin-type N-terminal cleavage/methylation domain-containing protein